MSTLKLRTIEVSAAFRVLIYCYMLVKHHYYLVLPSLWQLNTATTFLGYKSSASGQWISNQTQTKKVLNSKTVKSTQRQQSMCPWPAQKGYKSQSGHLLPAGKKPVSRRDRDARRLPSHVAATAECFRDLSACCPLSSVKCQLKPANLEPGSTTCKQKSQTKETSTLQTFTCCPQYS